MALNKIKFGNYIKLFSQKCNIPNLTNNDISGVNKDKEFFEPSPQIGGDTSKYKIVPPGYFACNLMHVGRDVVLPIAYNHSNKNKIVSPAYFVFKFVENDFILSDYFFLLLKCHEKDRFFWFNTDASVRDGMAWEDFVKVQIEVPDLITQQKYVDIYVSMQKNQQAYENGLEDLKLVCNGYIEDLRRKLPCQEIGKYLKIRNEQNINLKFKLKDVKGVSQNKKIIETKAKITTNDLSKFTVIYPKDFIYNPRNGIAIALNNSNNNYIISWNNTAFYIEEKFSNILLSEYLMLWFLRSEWDRNEKFNSWGSSTEVYSFNSLGLTKIPIPNIKVQESIANIYKVYIERKEINEKLKQQLKDICPILIKGSIDEARGS